MAHWRGFLLWVTCGWHWQFERSAVLLSIKLNGQKWQYLPENWLNTRLGYSGKQLLKGALNWAYDLSEEDLKSCGTGVTVCKLLFSHLRVRADTTQRQLVSLGVTQWLKTPSSFSLLHCGWAWQVNNGERSVSKWKILLRWLLFSVVTEKIVPVGLQVAAVLGYLEKLVIKVKCAHLTQDRCFIVFFFFFLLDINEGRKM